MSVLKNDRGVSKLQYYDTASQLQEYTSTHVRKLYNTNNPLSIVLGNVLVQLAIEITNNTKIASIKDLKKIDPEYHKQCLIRAYGSLNALISQIDQAYLQFRFSENIMLGWMELVDKEETLLSKEIYNTK